MKFNTLYILLFVLCFTNKAFSQAPTVTTTVSSTYASALLGGEVTNDGGSTVTKRGVLYGTTATPTSANGSEVEIGSGVGTFSQEFTGLTPSTIYYVRAYAINSFGTSYGSEMSFTTSAFCGGNIIGSGFEAAPSTTFNLDGNWKIVALPQGYTPEKDLPYKAYVPKIADIHSTNIWREGYTVDGATYYWIAPNTNTASLQAGSYNWIVQQTFNVEKAGFYDLKFSGAGDNAISFYINGEIDATDSRKPIISGGTQIGARHDSYTALADFSGVTYLNVGVNTASMLMEDTGGKTTALISGSTFTCNTTYINVNPIISEISAIAMVEGATSSPIAFTVSDQETPLNNLTVTASSSNTDLISNGNIELVGNTGNRTVRLITSPYISGKTTITITVDDNAGGVVTRTFIVTVMPIGLNKYGSIITDFTQMVNKNGAIGSDFGVNKNGVALQTKSYDLITTGLVMHLDAGNRSSYPGEGNVWNDISGYVNNGTLINNPTYDTSNGGNLVFNGSNTYVDAPLTKTASCTFSVWSKSTNTNSGNMLFNAGDNDVGPDLFFSGGILSWNTWDSSANPFGSIPATSNDGNWHNYVVVNDAVSNTAKLYYDGVLYGTADYKDASVSTSLFIGGTTSTYMWNGAIGNFQVHNRILTPEEVVQNFNNLKARYGL